MQSEYKTLFGQNIFDVVLSTYADLNLTYKLIEDNGIKSIDFDLDTTPALSIVYEIIPKIPAEIKVKDPVPTSLIKILKAINGQSIFDIILMTYGSLDLSYKLIQDNGIDSVNIGSVDQILFSFDSTLIADNFVYLKNINQSINYGTLEIDVLPSGALETASEEPLETADGIQILIA